MFFFVVSSVSFVVAININSRLCGQKGLQRLPRKTMDIREMISTAHIIALSSLGEG